MSTKTFYKLGEYYKNGVSGPTRYRPEAVHGTVVADGIVKISRYDHQDIVLEAELADTPKRAFDMLVVEKQLAVELAKLVLERAEKALRKASTAHDDWLEDQAQDEAERARRVELERQRLNRTDASKEKP